MGWHEVGVTCPDSAPSCRLAAAPRNPSNHQTSEQSQTNKSCKPACPPHSSRHAHAHQCRTHFETLNAPHERTRLARAAHDALHYTPPPRATAARSQVQINTKTMGYSLETTDNNAPTYTHVKKAAIIGAGVAGLQLAERLTTTADGIEVTIFESTNKVGGVWSSNYADFGLQVPKELYEFPSFPYPTYKEWDQFPKGPDVQEYIEAFAAHFDLNRLIKFNTSVLDATPLEGGWLVTVAPRDGSAAPASEAFDFVVVATGMYGGACPHIPNHPGKEAFEGEVLHSFNFTRREQAAGKRVVVVGGGKSAVDCAVAAVKGGAREVTLLQREAHWPVPRKILDLIPFQWATYSRFGHALLPTHHDVSPLTWWLHSLFTPLKWLVWRLVELIFAFQFRLSGEMVPTSRIEIDVFTGGQILTYEARDMIRSGALKVRKDSINRYKADGVELWKAYHGASIAADLVVYGTGFIKNYDYLDAEVQRSFSSSVTACTSTARCSLLTCRASPSLARRSPHSTMCSRTACRRRGSRSSSRAHGPP